MTNTNAYSTQYNLNFFIYYGGLSISNYSGVAGSGFASAAQADVSLNAFFEKREVQIARFSTSEYASRINPTDAEIEAFYKDWLGLPVPERA